jgi:hypothetical protein
MSEENSPSEENATGPTIPVDPPSPPETPSDTPPKKRRGRPPKNPSLITEGVSSGSAESVKPGREKGTRRAAFTTTDIDAMGKQLVGIHLLLVQVTGIPEMQISADEGKALAQSVVNIAEQYDLEIDGKTGAAIQLFATAAMIYGPRAFHYRARMSQASQAPQNGNPPVS